MENISGFIIKARAPANDKKEFDEIARLREDGTFNVLGREYKSLFEYIKEKEGL